VKTSSLLPDSHPDAAKWRQPSADLDEPLHIIEISDPDKRQSEE
jgi:hypothetical protein